MNTQHSQYLLPPLRCVKQEPFENRQLNHRGLGFTKSERDEVSFFKIVCKREVDWDIPSFFRNNRVHVHTEEQLWMAATRVGRHAVGYAMLRARA